MRNFAPDNPRRIRRTDTRCQVAVADDACSLFPTPVQICFEIGVALTVTLGIALAANLLALALAA